MTTPSPVPSRPRLRSRIASARRRAAVVTSAALLAAGAGVAVSAPDAPAVSDAPAVAVAHAPAEVHEPPPATLLPPVVAVSDVRTGEPETPAAEGQPIGGGRASYYGAELAGNPTASGETFDPAGMTAAHRTLPFGTRVRVTNERNGESVVVRINDRGPFHGERVIDVSTAAAEEIGLKRAGTAHVTLERLPQKPVRG